MRKLCWLSVGYRTKLSPPNPLLFGREEPVLRNAKAARRYLHRNANKARSLCHGTQCAEQLCAEPPYIRMAALEDRLDDRIAEEGENTREYLGEQFEDMEARLRRLGETANYVKVNADGDPLDDDDDDDDDEEALLGEGSFGKLLRMKHIPENALRAVKVIKISKAKSDGCSLDKLLSEAHILNMLTHESIVRYWGHLFCGTVKNPALQKCKLVAHNNKNRNSSAAA